ncbi:MAG: EAL domain-containing protein [Rhodanobacter sp.]
MRIYLPGKVSRRLIFQFLLAALIPMSGMAWYVYHQVSTMLLDSAYDQLRADCKSFGMSLIETLEVRANELKQLARDGSDHVPTAKPGFNAISVQTNRKLSAAQRAQIDRGMTMLLLTAGRPVELFARSAASGDVLAGQVDVATLWTNDSAPERYCILDASFAPLYCTSGQFPLDRRFLYETLGDRNGATVRWSPAGEDLLVALWRPKFLPTFDSPGFVVMQVTPRADALLKLQDFRYLFPFIFLLALSVAAGLAIGQIRRQMKPLDLLTKVTSRLAAGDLTARVDLEGNDEFTELAQTFNDMAVNLQYRFHMLALLSELDHDIINGSRIEHVANEVLGSIRKAIPCDGAGLLVRGGGDGYHLLTSAPDEMVPCSRTATAKLDLNTLRLKQPVSVLEPHVLPSEFLGRLSDGTPPRCLFAFPIITDDRLQQVLVVAFAQPPQSADNIIQGGRSLADRLGIALSNLAREGKLYHQAHHDSLTDLPNRVLLHDRCEQAIIRARHNQTAAALILIDLDNFKQVNDTLGHASGDQLLSRFAARLKLHLRQGDTLARLGGDEFVILLQDLARGEEYEILDPLLRELSIALSAPITVNEHQINTPASMGVALYPENAEHFGTLLQMADAAMYKSKREHPGGFHFYSSDLNRQSKARFDLTQELRDAVKRDELILYYQPKVDARSRQIVGAEALVRWNSPARGLVPPATFVHLLDEMGLGVWLGEWVLDRVCAQMRVWQDDALISIPVSINMSPAQVEHTPVVERIKASLERYQLDASRLEIEILEATAVNDSREVRETLLALGAEGIRVALDDFGTGYSSLVYLTRIPAHVLKLDQAFIQGLPADPRQQEIVKHIIALAKSLSYSVVAEGVEEEAQLSLLVALGCDHIQGYLIGRPVPPEEFADRWLRQAAPGPAGLLEARACQRPANEPPSAVALSGT